jgi:glycosyltransferase involved in cell wall biosynthesis
MGGRAPSAVKKAVHERTQSDSARSGLDVSVVIPTRNRSQLLALAIESALDQRGVELEVIVIDEASTDGTSAIVNRLADPRVRLIRHDAPLGKSAARNRGIAEARGAWIAFLDDDDIWAPDKLLLQLKALSETGRQWAYTGAVNITQDHRILGGAPPRPPDEVAKSLRQVNGVPGGCSSVIVSRCALPPQGFDEAYRLCEDWDLWIRLARTAPPACVPKPLVGYRVHAGNSSVDTARLLAELDMIEDRHGGPVDRLVFYRHLARVCLRVNWQWQALGYYLRALADSPTYLVRGFIPDVIEALWAMVDRVRTRLGRPGRLSEPQRSDPQSAWRDEARRWLEEFVRRHSN